MFHSGGSLLGGGAELYGEKVLGTSRRVRFQTSVSFTGAHSNVPCWESTTVKHQNQHSGDKMGHVSGQTKGFIFPSFSTFRTFIEMENSKVGTARNGATANVPLLCPLWLMGVR
jgi:hypothetical protein